jgi:hypothetical protein
LRSATRFRAPRGSPAASAWAAAVIGESICDRGGRCPPDPFHGRSRGPLIPRSAHVARSRSSLAVDVRNEIPPHLSLPGIACRELNLSHRGETT